MHIQIASGVGSGPTELAAFDAALRSAGVENHNLIALSSVIPPGAVLERARYQARPCAYGKNERELVGGTCEGEPLCALVLVVYQSEPCRG